MRAGFQPALIFLCSVNIFRTPKAYQTVSKRAGKSSL